MTKKDWSYNHNTSTKQAFDEILTNENYRTEDDVIDSDLDANFANIPQAITRYSDGFLLTIIKDDQSDKDHVGIIPYVYSNEDVEFKTLVLEKDKARVIDSPEEADWQALQNDMRIMLCGFQRDTQTLEQAMMTIANL